MPLITWTEELSIGVEAVDSDHQLLVHLINQLDEAVEDGQGQDTVGSVLNVLFDYTEYHFDREELLMEACGYVGFEKHRDMHSDLKAKVVEIRDAFLADEKAVLGVEVLQFLKDWLTDHIIGQDKLFKDCLASRPDEVERAVHDFAEKMARIVAEEGSDESLL